MFWKKIKLKNFSTWSRELFTESPDINLGMAVWFWIGGKAQLVERGFDPGGYENKIFLS